MNADGINDQQNQKISTDDQDASSEILLESPQPDVQHVTTNSIKADKESVPSSPRNGQKTSGFDVFPYVEGLDSSQQGLTVLRSWYLKMAFKNVRVQFHFISSKRYRKKYPAGYRRLN